MKEASESVLKGIRYGELRQSVLMSEFEAFMTFIATPSPHQ